MEDLILGVITPDSYLIKDKIFQILEKSFVIKKMETILLKDRDIEKLYTDPQNSIKKDWKKGASLIFLASRKKGIWSFVRTYLLQKRTKEEINKLVGDINQPGTIRGKFALSESKCAIYIPENQDKDFFFAS